MKKLLKFSATWCAPCKSLANNFKHVDLGDVELVSIDIEEDEDRENVIKFKICGDEDEDGGYD